MIRMINTTDGAVVTWSAEKFESRLYLMRDLYRTFTDQGFVCSAVFLASAVTFTSGFVCADVELSCFITPYRSILTLLMIRFGIRLNLLKLAPASSTRAYDRFAKF